MHGSAADPEEDRLARPVPTAMASDQKPNLWQHAGMGLEFASAVVAMTLLGWAVDHGMGTEPWGLVIGALLGLAGGMYNLIRKAMKMLK